MGPDTHVRVQQLLVIYAQREEYHSLETLRHQLGAIIARSEAELRLFDSLFNDYVAEYDIAWGPKGSDGQGAESTDQERQRSGRWWYLLSFLPLLAFGLLYLLPLPKPSSDRVFLAAAQQADHPQTITFRDQSDYRYPWWALAKELPQPDSLRWDLGDGTVGQGDSLTHHYQQPGNYLVRQLAFFGTDTLQKAERLTVRPIPRLRVNFKEEKLADDQGYRFSDRSTLYQGDTRYRPWDTLQEIRYHWDLGTYGTIEGAEATLSSGDGLQPTPRFNAKDTLRVQLTVTARWRDTTVIDSARREIYPFEPPTMPPLQGYLVDADLSDLVKAPAQTPWPFWLMLALTLSYLIYEVVRAWRRQVALDESPQRGPPLRQPLELEAPPLDVFHTRQFAQAARELRRRRAGEQRRLPDVLRSVRLSAQRAGFPEIAYRLRTQPSQYLLLIEQHSPQDHLAQLFAALGHELAARDISVEVYFFAKEPRLCWRKSRRERIPLAELRNLYPDYRLLIIGAGEALLDEDGDELAPWTDAFETWSERAWLSDKPTESWGRTEEALFRRFLVVPATQLGFLRLVEQWQAEEHLTPRDWRKLAYESDFPRGDRQAALPLADLRAYLGRAGFHWLTALAWYPELTWPLSLRLGKLIEPMQGQAQPLNMGLDGLIRLFRLPWLRQGSLPRELREALAQVQPDAQAEATRDLLLQLLREPRNLPPPDSYAAADQQLRLALFEYLNSSRDPRDRQALRQALATLDPDDIEDRLSLQELSRVPSPLSLIVPARYFRGRIPLLGLPQRWRMLWIGLPLLIGLGLSAYFAQWEPSLGHDPQRSYQAAEIDLQNAQDSARWLTHEGYLMGTDSLNPLATGDSLFAAALQLAPADSLAQHNFTYSRYQLAHRLYEARQHAAAIDTLRAGAIPLGSGLSERKDRGMRWYLALLGINELLTLDLENGSVNLSRALCQEQAGPLSPVAATQPEEGASTVARRREVREPTELRDLVEDQNLRLLLVSREAQDTLNLLFDLKDCLGYQPALPRVYRSNLQVIFSNSSGVAPMKITLLARADKPIKRYIWQWSDDTRDTTTDGSLIKELTNAGNYRVRLTAEFLDGTNETMTAIETIKVNKQGLTYEAARDSGLRALNVQRFDDALIQFEAAAILLGNSDFEREIDSLIALAKDRYVFAIRDELNKQMILKNIPKPLLTGLPAYETFRDSGLRAIDASNLEEALIQFEAAEVMATSSNNLDFITEIELLISLIYDAAREAVPNFPTMIRIPGGTFQMGDVLGDNEGDREKPVHKITLSAFELGETEVTFAHFDAFCDATQRRKPRDEGWGRGDRPVINVTWFDALDYCNWCSEQKGLQPVYTFDGFNVRVNWEANGYRLPTEAEWEYAAGKFEDAPHKYAGNPNQENLPDYAWYKVNAQSTMPVGTKAANGLGLFDMSGNALEWCFDWYTAYPSSYTQNPKGPESGSRRVIRGGGWQDEAFGCRVSYRYSFTPTSKDLDIGFRLARTP